MKRTTENTALFILRVSLGLFLLLWSIDKLVAPSTTVKIFEMFYMMPISLNIAYIVGALEVILSVSIIVGYKKHISYLIGLIVHGISTLSTYTQLLSPFGKNHLFIAAIPVLGAFIALYMLRDKDKLWTV